MVIARHFKEREFQKCTPSCSLQNMQQEFITLLDNLRDKVGIPIVLNSAYRTVAYEKSKGRSGNSAHTRGLAVDIRCYNGATKQRLMDAARELGVTRFGVGKTFLHIDIDKTLPQNTTWGY